jgi:hypothetical protein
VPNIVHDEDHILHIELFREWYTHVWQFATRFDVTWREITELLELQKRAGAVHLVCKLA